MILNRVGFRGRLLLALLGLVSITSVTIAGAFMLSSLQEEKARAEERLRVAEDVTREIVRRRTNVLFSVLTVLVEDFGFKSAIATRELPTMLSALENQSKRFNSSLAIITDHSGNILANLHGLENDSPFPFPALMQDAVSHGMASRLIVQNSNAYQALMVPIHAPGLRAWLVMGFPLDDAFAYSLSQLTGVNIAFLEAGPSYPQATLSGNSLDDDQVRASLDSEITNADSSHGRSSDLPGMEHFFSRQFNFSDAADNPVSVILLLDRQEALASYYEMALNLLILVLICFALAALMALIMARALGRPVLELADFARAISANRDAQPPARPPAGELRALRDTLMAMPHKIRHREHRIHHAATHDALTGLPNRPVLRERVQACLASREDAFLVCYSIAGLQTISESLGFGAGDGLLFGTGDELLVATAMRIRSQFPPETLVARSAGNEFMVLIPDGDRTRLHERLQAVRATCEQTTIIQQTPISIQLVSAILTLPQDAVSLDDVRRRINLTQDRAAQSPDLNAFYVQGGDEHHLRELRIIRDLQGAMTQNQLFMQYQPQVQMRQANVIQVEALLRWEHPELGFINPEELIRVAERSGQIHHLTDYILRCVERDSRVWRHGKKRALGIAINLSALDLNNQKLPQLVDTIFADWERPLKNLTFEITEGAILTDLQSALKTLAGLRALGVTLSVDDFGTGYSSLSQMRHLPVQELKIDKSFVLRLDSQQEDQLIVKSTLDMAHGLGLKVVAEGIENEATWRLLQAWGCEMAQGYFIGRPMPLAKLTQWLDSFPERSRTLAQKKTSICGGV